MIRSFSSLPNTPHYQPKERGQAIVIIAFAMIALLAFTGLAIDGGGLIALYRDAVNATDASVLAASYAICVDDMPEPIQAGLETAKKNGFDNNGVTNWVTVTWPANVNGVDNADYVQVEIRAEKPAYFIQVVRQEPLIVNTKSVAYCRQKLETTEVSGVFGISECGCSGPSVDFSASQINIYGSTYSNGCSSSSSGQDNYAIYGGNVNTGGGTSNSSEFTFYPDPPAVAGSVQSAPSAGNPLSVFDIAEYAPGGEIYEAVSVKTVVKTGAIPAGWSFQAGAFQPSGEINGLYYVEGDVTIGNNDDVTWGPNGATIVATGAMNINTDKEVSQRFYSELLTLSNTISVPSAGFLYFTTYGAANYANMADACNANVANDAISFSGTNNTSGVIYAPNGAIDLNFPNNNSDPNRCGINHTGPLVGWIVDLSGSRGCIVEDPSLIPPMPPKVYVAQ